MPVCVVCANARASSKILIKQKNKIRKIANPSIGIPFADGDFRLPCVCAVTVFAGNFTSMRAT